MRTVDSKLITGAVKDLFLKANTSLRSDILLGLKLARKKETSEKARYAMDVLIKNAFIAKKNLQIHLVLSLKSDLICTNLLFVIICAFIDFMNAFHATALTLKQH